MAYVTVNGVTNLYGPPTETEYNAVEHTFGQESKIKYHFTYDDLPTYQSNFVFPIPENAVLTEASFQVITAFAGGTSYDIGLETGDGTDIDADGLWDALVLADINAADEFSLSSGHGGTNSGALLNNGSLITADAYLLVAATGTFTAGEAEVVITYIPRPAT